MPKALALAGELIFNKKVRDGWTKVEPKKTKEKKQKPKIRLRAIIISNTDTMSYSNILKKVKATPELIH